MATPEQEIVSEIPDAEAGLIRLYWTSQKDGEQPKLSLRSYLSCIAASLLYKADKVDNLVVCIGQQWGEKYPPLSELAEKLLIKTGVASENIKIFSNAQNSEQETTDFLQYAKGRGFTKLIDIGFLKHEKSRKRGYEKLDREPERFVSVEQIINTVGSSSILGSGYQELLQELKHSKHEVAYALYEGAKNIIYTLKLDHLIEQKTADRGRMPGPVWKTLYEKFSFDMDAFDLPK